MSVADQAQQLALHWITSSGIYPTALLDILLCSPRPVQKDGFIVLEKSHLEAPSVFSDIVCFHMDAIIMEVVKLTQPTVVALNMISSRQNNNALCARTWTRVKQYYTMPPLWTSALRIPRADLQALVSKTYGILLRATCDPDRLESWIFGATQRWNCTIGSRFMDLVGDAIGLAQIQCLATSASPSIGLWGDHGIVLTKSDHILLFLLLVCGPPQLLFATRPEGCPEPVSNALSATWLCTVRSITPLARC